MKVGRVYVIFWLDHRDGVDAGQAWHELSKIDSPSMLLRSVGYVVKLNRRDVLIAHTMDDEHSTTPFTIVRRAIISATEIKLPKTPKEAL